MQTVEFTAMHCAKIRIDNDRAGMVRRGTTSNSTFSFIGIRALFLIYFT
jgi:hypothetical protein